MSKKGYTFITVAQKWTSFIDILTKEGYTVLHAEKAANALNGKTETKFYLRKETYYNGKDYSQGVRSELCNKAGA